MLRTRPQRRSATALRRATEGESSRTILIALLANIVIGIAKLFSGVVSGSTGMFAEAAHSAADSVNEIFLAVGIYRDREAPDPAHPFGHGRERFLWAFMAAIASFLIGGCLSIALAIAELKARHPLSRGLTAWIVLAVAFTADGTSWLQGMRQARRQVKDYKLSVWRYFLVSSDPVVRAVLVEDSAALIGLLVAATGLFLSKILKRACRIRLRRWSSGYCSRSRRSDWPVRSRISWWAGRSLRPCSSSCKQLFSRTKQLNGSCRFVRFTRDPRRSSSPLRFIHRHT